jgi:hypothetical protein
MVSSNVMLVIAMPIHKLNITMLMHKLNITMPMTSSTSPCQ